jgi:uncharacterized protein
MKSVTRMGAVISGMCGLALLLGLAACQPAAPQAGPPRFSSQEVAALEQAAEKGDPLDKYNLGKKFRDGDTVPQSFTNAAVWFRKAADGGYAKAQYHLGLAYEDGEGLAKDMAEAVKWYRKAADQDNAKAQEKLGFILWKGDGVAKNLVEAHKWLSLAGEGGEAKAGKAVKKIELSMTPQEITEAKKQAAAFTPRKEFKKLRKDKQTNQP